MDIRILASAPDFAAWTTFVRGHALGSLWQSPEWKSYQEALGRETRVYGAFAGHDMAAGALVVIDRTTGNLATWDIPRGPVGSPEAAQALVERILSDARAGNALVLRFSPLLPSPFGEAFAPSGRHIQPDATRVLDLALDDDALLAQMKPKGRYNVRLAQRHDIEVRENGDVAAFHGLMKRTGARDRFGIHPESHYRAFLERLPGAFLLLAYHPRTSETDPVSGLLGATWGATGIYYYGASDERHRALMAPYVLQWAAMQKCRALSCTSYDLLGVAPPDAGDGHPWAGITSFKEKFGGELVAYPPERQAVLRPMAWKLLQLKRRILG